MLTAEACADVASLVFIAGMLLGGVICALGWVLLRQEPKA